MGLLAFAIMILIKKYFKKLPYVLIAVVITTLISYFTGFERNITTANDNIAIGKDALSALTTGTGNIMLSEGGGSITTGSDNIIIGIWPTNVSGAAVTNELNLNNTIYATSMRSSSVKVGIGNGNQTPNSTLDVKGSVSKSIVTKTADYTPTDQDYTILYTSNGPDLTLPSANSCKGRIYVVATTDFSSSTVKIRRGGSDNIIYKGTNTVLYIGATGSGDIQSYTLQSDGGSNWIVIAVVK
jgi:hypothetical protein